VAWLPKMEDLYSAASGIPTQTSLAPAQPRKAPTLRRILTSRLHQGAGSAVDAPAETTKTNGRAAGGLSGALGASKWGKVREEARRVSIVPAFGQSTKSSSKGIAERARAATAPAEMAAAGLEGGVGGRREGFAVEGGVRAQRDDQADVIDGEAIVKLKLHNGSNWARGRRAESLPWECGTILERRRVVNDALEERLRRLNERIRERRESGGPGFLAGARASRGRGSWVKRTPRIAIASMVGDTSESGSLAHAVNAAGIVSRDRINLPAPGGFEQMGSLEALGRLRELEETIIKRLAGTKRSWDDQIRCAPPISRPFTSSFHEF
jgi:hypothetical protein